MVLIPIGADYNTKWGPVYKISSHEKVLNFLNGKQYIFENRRLSKKKNK